MRAFSSAKDVLSVFPQFQPQVLISDIAMPNEDGFTLIQAIRSFSVEQGGKIPVIALSAMASDENQQRALAAGLDRHLTKPMDFEELTSTLLNIPLEAR